MSKRHVASVRICTVGTARSDRLGRRRQSLLTLAASTAVLGAAGVSSAQFVSWAGPAGTPAPFEVGANWTGGNVPGGGDLAAIENGGIATLSTNQSVLGFKMGSDPGKSGTIIQTAGLHEDVADLPQQIQAACEVGNWTIELRTCFAAGTTTDALQACILPDEQH